jgi:hypothetical protein
VETIVRWDAMGARTAHLCITIASFPLREGPDPTTFGPATENTQECRAQPFGCFAGSEPAKTSPWSTHLRRSASVSTPGGATYSHPGMGSDDELRMRVRPHPHDQIVLDHADAQVAVQEERGPPEHALLHDVVTIREQDPDTSGQGVAVRHQSAVSVASLEPSIAERATSSSAAGYHVSCFASLMGPAVRDVARAPIVIP